MKNTILAVLAVLVSLPSFGQRKCGNALLYSQLQRQQPEMYQELRAKQLANTRAALQQAPVASKTTAQSVIPVVFHIIVTQSQYVILGRDTGIQRRVRSQLAVLNRDFNRRNADSTLIPTAFKRLYANANIQFGSAKTTSANTISAGIEVKIAASAPNFDINNGFRGAKEASTNGLPAWDPSKYLNIWVIDASNTILGLTVSPSVQGYQFGNRVIDQSDLGVVLTYLAFGARDFAAQNFYPSNDLGRTLTHEVGHYFELFHTWGDDDDDNTDGYCPNERANGQQVGFDDGILDTPPQSRATYCDFPNHTGGNCPTFPLLDKCSPTSPGVMFMNFMDYVDDRAMQMFTTEQVAVMRREIAANGQSYSLTQNPGLATVAVKSLNPEAFQIFPNPASSAVTVTLGGNEQLQTIQLMNLTGQVVRNIPADGRRSYELETGDLSRGLYFVQCRFAEGTLSRKIVLQ